jgi:hypothetical protein
VRSVRIIVTSVLDASGAVSSEVGISPVRSPLGISPGVVRELDPGGGVRSPVGISPAQAVPESMHARTTAAANCLIFSVSPLRMPIYWHKISIV